MWYKLYRISDLREGSEKLKNYLKKTVFGSPLHKCIDFFLNKVATSDCPNSKTSFHPPLSRIINLGKNLQIPSQEEDKSVKNQKNCLSLFLNDLKKKKIR